MSIFDEKLYTSRPRTIVIGTRKEYIHFSPLNIFPLKQKQITVRDAIGDLPSLKFGEMSNDTLHFFREYPKYMEEWISHIAEGESAFNNEEQYKPYKIENGEKVILNSSIESVVSSSSKVSKTSKTLIIESFSFS